MNFFKNKFALVVGALALLAIAAGAIYYFQNSNAAARNAAPVVQTARVRRGDMVVVSSGAGVIEPAAQAELAFRSAGILHELNVQMGERVSASQVLARLEENIQADADFQALFNEKGVADAELAVAKAQDELDGAVASYAYLIGTDAWYWERRLNEAEEKLRNLDSSAPQTQRDELQKTTDDARSRRDYFINLRGIPALDMTSARANVESAKAKLFDAQIALNVVKAGPSALTSPLAAVGEQTAKLESARLAVENSRLVAPFDGAIVALDVVAGQAVNTAPVMTIAKMDELFARVYLDESDFDKIAVGKRVIIVLDAYPDNPIEGTVALVEPAVQSVDGSPVVAAWVSLSPDPALRIISGMNFEAEVIVGEAKDALIIPKQALRELEPGKYAVFVVGANGKLILTPVEAGLMDYANVEIISGLNPGDLVSSGNVETK